MSEDLLQNLLQAALQDSPSATSEMSKRDKAHTKPPKLSKYDKLKAARNKVVEVSRKLKGAEEEQKKGLQVT